MRLLVVCLRFDLVETGAAPLVVRSGSARNSIEVAHGQQNGHRVRTRWQSAVFAFTHPLHD